MEKLRAWRERHNLTLEQAGERFGVSGPALGRYEKGRLPERKVMDKIITETKGEVTANDWFDIPDAEAVAS